MTDQTVWAVVPAAGVGSRMGAALPKQYLLLNGATVLEGSLQSLLACRRVRAVVVVLHPDDRWVDDLAVLDMRRIYTAQGGAQRSDSVLSGLEFLATMADADDWVLVHDAARPCVLGTDIDKLVDKVLASGTGGLLAEPIVDTVKRAGDDRLVECTVDREKLWRAQTPQMFRLGELRNALRMAAEMGNTITDEASAMESSGHPVQLVQGSKRNLKITLPEDLALAEFYLQQGIP